MEFCKKNCAEKATEICNKNSEIEKLEGNFKDAKEEIAAKVNELEQRESELTVLNQKFETATSAIEENNKTIQVTLCCLKHFPHFTVISCQKFLLKLPNQYSYTFFHRKPLKVYVLVTADGSITYLSHILPSQARHLWPAALQ